MKYDFNCSFMTGLVPDCFKIARVIPVFKKGSNTQMSNYRPISLLSIFNKLLEKFIYKRLISFLNKHYLISNSRYGFRAKHSTTHAILMIIDKIQSAMEKGKYACGVFLDFSKAFDTVNHQILIQKRDNYGIRGLPKKWFCSYLTNRKQFVTIGNSTSDYRPILCGVPQGSVLGPLLFLIYINDFVTSSTVFDFHLFADDSNLFYTDKNLNEVEDTVNNELTKVSVWLNTNELSLNIDKSHFVIFHPTQKKVFPIKLEINN